MSTGSPFELSFVENQPARVTIKIATLAGVMTDPANLTVEYKKPSDLEPTVWVYGVDAEIVREETGVYHFDLPNDEPGRWKWYWESDGTDVEAADQGEYYVERKITE